MSEVKKWYSAKGEDVTDLAGKINTPEFHKAVLDSMLELAKVNKFSGLEKIKKIHCASEPFTIENEILTPTMKIKRNIAKDVYKAEIEKMYEGAN